MSKNSAAPRERAEKRRGDRGEVAGPIPRDDVLELLQVKVKIKTEELRRAKSALADARKKYFDLYNLAPIGYMSLDRSGCLREINVTGAEMLGRTRRQLIGSRFARFLLPAWHEDFHRFCTRLFESGKREEVKLQLSLSGRPMLPVLLSGIAIQDGEGNLSVCQVAVTDVSARIAGERWRQRLVETTQDAVIAIDSRAQIMLFNNSAERIFGYDAAEVVGKKINVLMAEPYWSEHDRFIEHYEHTGEKRAIGMVREAMARRKNGEVFPIELSVTEIGESDEPRYVAFIRDVSDKLRLQAEMIERTRLVAIGETAAQVAHEIANPLNGIAMTIQVLERRLLTAGDSTMHTTVERLEAELSRLKKLLFDFRDLSTEPRYNRRPLSLSSLVDELCTIQKPACESQGIRVDISIEPELPLIFADGDRIKQLLLNLCKNATEAMPNGGHMTVRGYQTNGCVNLEVRDTGSGISPDVDVFRAFKSTKEGGGGLGLVIARQIAAAHGGTLTYESKVGEGTAFVLSLPAMPHVAADKASD